MEALLSKESQKRLKQEYRNASAIIEYGSGGSTVFGATLGKPLVAVESNPDWLDRVEAAIDTDKVILVHSYIGEVKEWGFPKDDSAWAQWPGYSIVPWAKCKTLGINPDTVFIDGRFRVACFLASCVYTVRPIRILFDDYRHRTEYHIVEEIAKPSETVSNRMAIFDIEPNMVDVRFLLDNLRYFHSPA